VGIELQFGAIQSNFISLAGRLHVANLNREQVQKIENAAEIFSDLLKVVAVCHVKRSLPGATYSPPAGFPHCRRNIAGLATLSARSP